MIPEAWRVRWAGEAASYGVPDLPRRLDDDEVGGTWQEANEISRHTVASVRESLVPRLVRVPIDVGAWTPLERGRADEDRGGASVAVPASTRPSIVDTPGPAAIERLTFAARLIANLSPVAAKSMLLACPFDMTLAVAGDVVVGLVASARTFDGARELEGVWVAPPARRQGLATELLRRHVATEFQQPAATSEWRATVTVGERDPVEPLEHGLRMSIARRLLESAGFEITEPPQRVVDVDPSAVAAIRR
jgi:GNAT superfamily N-acetyltransferase